MINRAVKGGSELSWDEVGNGGEEFIFCLLILAMKGTSLDIAMTVI